jgi:hypothetical protein
VSEDGRTPRGAVSILRRVIVTVIIVSFSIAAIGGIVVLLGGSLGETAGRVLGTTAVVGAFSIAVLCCAALIGRRLQPFGMIGAAVSVIAAALVVTMIWYQPDGYPGWWDTLWQLVWTATAASVAFALASLLLLLADRRQIAVRIGLVVTLALFAIVLLLVVYAIWWSDTIEGDLYGRVLGIASILAALGAIVVPVLSLLLRRGERPAGTGLSDAARARIEAEAARREMTPDDLVAALLSPPPAEP